MNPRSLAGAIAAVVMAASMAMGFEGYREQPYRDVGGVLTVCFGHTGGVEARRYQRAECEALLQKDMAEANQAVHRCIRSPMTLGQEAGLTDATYNIGPAVVCGSTLQRKANAGDWVGACAELSRWDKVTEIKDGKRVEKRPLGLTKRRAADRAMCEGRYDLPVAA